MPLHDAVLWAANRRSRSSSGPGPAAVIGPLTGNASAGTPTNSAWSDALVAGKKQAFAAQSTKDVHGCSVTTIGPVPSTVTAAT